MPYEIKKIGKSYSVINKDTKHAFSKHTTKGKAQAQLRLLLGVEHGLKPRKKK